MVNFILWSGRQLRAILAIVLIGNQHEEGHRFKHLSR